MGWRYLGTFNHRNHENIEMFVNLCLGTCSRLENGRVCWCWDKCSRADGDLQLVESVRHVKRTTISFIVALFCYHGAAFTLASMRASLVKAILLAPTGIIELNSGPGLHMVSIDEEPHDLDRALEQGNREALVANEDSKLM